MMFVVVDASLFRRGGGEEQPKYFLQTGDKQQHGQCTGGLDSSIAASTKLLS